MNVDKAYLLGLVIGGGYFGNSEDFFEIRLPFKKWGSFKDEPQRAGQIAKDIFNAVSPILRSTYGLNVSYQATENKWFILCEGDLANLQTDLEKYGITCAGELRKEASIDKIVIDLVDDNMKRRFIAGLADVIGSTKESHRRHTADYQAISFEIPGFRYDSVCSLCRLLHSIKCYPDQVLWNHPNMHSGQNRIYKQWKKGFKIRVLADQFADFGSFAFSSKAQAIKDNLKLQNSKKVATPCGTKKLAIRDLKCIHLDESSPCLPPEIRGGHYIHYGHFCAVLGCEHAQYNQISTWLNKAENYIVFFARLTKGTESEIENFVKSDKLLADRDYRISELKASDLFSQYKSNKQLLLFGNNTVGYPISAVIDALAYLVTASSGTLKGSSKRPPPRERAIQEYLKNYPETKIEVSIPDLRTPIILSFGGYSALVGAHNPTVYKKLISIDPCNKYKLLVRPITEDDLK